MNIRVGPPEIGQWYAHADKGEPFQVVARDDYAGTIEIQSLDGEVDEIDLETWNALPLEHSEPPEDWTAPIDGVARDNLGYSEMAPEDWAPPQLSPTRGDKWDDTDSSADEQDLRR